MALHNWDRAKYLAFHDATLKKMSDVTFRKNHDYAGGGDDPFFNFTRVEENGVCSTETGFLARMSDKYSRITTFVNKGILKVADESVVDTLIDMANYCILMAGFIQARREKAEDDAKLVAAE